jgi:hypothetical protein
MYVLLIKTAVRGASCRTLRQGFQHHVQAEFLDLATVERAGRGSGYSFIVRLWQVT